MDHLAILSKELPWLQRIESGQKIIESRWYQQKRKPWHTIQLQDKIFFKNTGAPVSLMASVGKIEFYDHLTPAKIEELISLYGSRLGLIDNEKALFISKIRMKQYGILIFLEDVQTIKPFAINKKGYGAMSAWISLPNIELIKQK